MAFHQFIIKHPVLLLLPASKHDQLLLNAKCQEIVLVSLSDYLCFVKGLTTLEFKDCDLEASLRK